MPSATPVHLVGSPEIQEKKLLSTLGDAQIDLSKVEFATNRYFDRQRENVALATGYDQKIITGADALRHALKVHADLHSGERLDRFPIVSLGAACFALEAQVRGVYEQVNGIPSRYRETVRWTAPTTMEVSRGIFHDLTGKLDTDRAGNLGRGMYDDVLVARAFETMHTHYERHGGARKIVIADDRTSAKHGSLIDAARDLMQAGQAFYRSAGVEVVAYVVGHAASPRLDEHDRPYTISNPRGDGHPRVPLYAPVFRYNHASEVGKGKAEPADELKDLGYFDGAGHNLIQGYISSQPALRMAYAALNNLLPIAREKGYLRSDSLGALLAAGIEITDMRKFQDYMVAKAERGEAIVGEDIRKLFSRRNEAEKGILQIQAVPNFNPDVLEQRRVPMLWPGKADDNTFFNSMDERRWLQLSRAQLQNTIEYISEVEAVTGQHVPRRAVPFLDLPIALEKVSDRTLKTDRALDNLTDLRFYLDEGHRRHSINEGHSPAHGGVATPISVGAA